MVVKARGEVTASESAFVIAFDSSVITAQGSDVRILRGTCTNADVNAENPSTVKEYDVPYHATFLELEAIWSSLMENSDDAESDEPDASQG